MNCEHCSQKIDGFYGSGRFCNRKCACAFSTKEKRQEINLAVSKKLTGRSFSSEGQFKKGYDSRRRKFNQQDWAKAVEVNQIRLKELYESLDWNELPLPEKRRRILQEQENKCLKCRINEWMGESVVLELHHVDGNDSNNVRQNLQILCPNCHSQTDNWCRKKSIKDISI